MANINLLPWREEERKIQAKEFYMLSILAICATVLLCILIHLILASHLRDQNKVNDFFKNQITILDQQIANIQKIKQQKTELIKRMEIVHHLETNRIEIVHMFDEFVKTLPDGIYINSVSKKKKIITITGEAQTNDKVSDLMKNLDASPSFMNPELTEIKVGTKDDPRVRFFQLDVQIEPLGTIDPHDRTHW